MREHQHDPDNVDQAATDPHDQAPNLLIHGRRRPLFYIEQQARMAPPCGWRRRVYSAPGAAVMLTPSTLLATQALKR